MLRSIQLRLCTVRRNTFVPASAVPIPDNLEHIPPVAVALLLEKLFETRGDRGGTMSPDAGIIYRYLLLGV